MSSGPRASGSLMSEPKARGPEESGPSAQGQDGLGELIDRADVHHGPRRKGHGEAVLEFHDEVHDGQRIDGYAVGDHGTSADRFFQAQIGRQVMANLAHYI